MRFLDFATHIGSLLLPAPFIALVVAVVGKGLARKRKPSGPLAYAAEMENDTGAESFWASWIKNTLTGTALLILSLAFIGQDGSMLGYFALCTGVALRQWWGGMRA